MDPSFTLRSQRILHSTSGNAIRTLRYGSPLSDQEKGQVRRRTREHACNDSARSEDLLLPQGFLHAVEAEDHEEDWLRSPSQRHRLQSTSLEQLQEPSFSDDELDEVQRDILVSRRADDKWPPHLAAAFLEAIHAVPPIGRSQRRVLMPDGSTKLCGRNELISRRIWKTTADTRTRKQVMSRLQTMKKKLSVSAELRRFIDTSKDPSYQKYMRGLVWNDEECILVSEDPGSASAIRPPEVPRMRAATDHSQKQSTNAERKEPFLVGISALQFKMCLHPADCDGSTGIKIQHTYTTMQDTQIGRPKLLHQISGWQMLFPDLYRRLCGGNKLPKNIILLEASFDLGDVVPMERSRLGVHFFADLRCEDPPKEWRHDTIFYEGGKKSQAYWDPVAVENIGSAKYRAELPLASKWWVKVFSNISLRRGAHEQAMEKTRQSIGHANCESVCETCEHIRLGYQRAMAHEDRNARRYLREMTAMQEFCAVDPSSECGPQSRVIFLWTFRQTNSGERGTTTWRRLDVDDDSERRVSAFPGIPTNTDQDLRPWREQALLQQPTPTTPWPDALQHTENWDSFVREHPEIFGEPQADLINDDLHSRGNGAGLGPYDWTSSLYQPDLSGFNNQSGYYDTFDMRGEQFTTHTLPNPAAPEVPMVNHMDKHLAAFGDHLSMPNYSNVFDAHDHFETLSAGQALTEFAGQPPATLDANLMSTDPNLEDFTGGTINLSYDVVEDPLECSQYLPAHTTSESTPHADVQTAIQGISLSTSFPENSPPADSIQAALLESSFPVKKLLVVLEQGRGKADGALIANLDVEVFDPLSESQMAGKLTTNLAHDAFNPSTASIRNQEETELSISMLEAGHAARISSDHHHRHQHIFEPYPLSRTSRSPPYQRVLRTSPRHRRAQLQQPRAQESSLPPTRESSLPLHALLAPGPGDDSVQFTPRGADPDLDYPLGMFADVGHGMAGQMMATELGNQPAARRLVDLCSGTGAAETVAARGI